MKVRIRVFGRYKNITNKDMIQLNIGKGNKLSDIINCFVKQYPITEKDRNHMMVSINKKYASYDTIITEDDEITLSPPVVAGG